MGEWKEYKLGDLGTIITGKTPSSKNPEDWGNEMLFVTPTDYCNYRKYSDDSIRKLSNIGIKRLKNKILPPSSILVTCIGSDMGKVVMTKSYCITNQQINSIIPNNLVNPDFLYYTLISSYDTLRVLGGDGTAVPIVNKNDFSNISINIPSLSEQKRIVSILGSLDDKIDLLHHENETLEAMAETFFRKWFIEDAKEICKTCKISDVIDFNPHRKLFKGTNSLFLEMTNLNTSTYCPKAWYNKEFTSGTKFINGDTLLARITPCLENGKTAYIDILKEKQVGWGSTEFIIMRPKLGLHPFFAYILAKYQDFRDFAESCMSGSSGRQRVDIENLKNYDFRIPNKRIIDMFNDSIIPIISKMKNNNNEIFSLRKMRDILLHKLMLNEIK